MHQFGEKTRAKPGGDVRNWADRDPDASGLARIVHFEAHTPDASEPGCMRMGQPLRLSMDIEFYAAVERPTFGILIHSIMGEPLLDFRSVHGDLRLGRVDGGLRIEATIPNLALYPGEYLLSPWVADRTQKRNMDWARNVLTLLVLPPDEGPDDLRRTGLWGKYWVPSQWRVCSGSAETLSEAAGATN